MSATTARRALTVRPVALCTPTARPPRTSIRSTCSPVNSSAPAALARLASAAASSPAPPTGTGNPCCCPVIASSQPNTPLIVASGGASACTALPASSNRAPSEAKSSSPMRPAGSARNRASRSASAVPIRRSSWIGPRTGGNAVKNVRSTASPTVSHCAHSRSHASPSCAACWASPAAVRSRSRWSTAAGSSPGRAGWASTAGACVHRSPCAPRSSDPSTGEAAESG
jgi:hypothetical protein